MSQLRILTAGLLLTTVSSATAAQQVDDGSQAVKRQAIQIEDEQIPYALRATMLLKMLGSMQEQPLADGGNRASRLLTRMGLEADSPAVNGLCEAALAVEAARPAQDPTEYLRLDPEEHRAIQRSRQLEIHRLAGERLGEWLRGLEMGESAVDSLLSQLLDSPYVGMTIGTTDPEIDIEFLAAKVRVFKDALQGTLGYVPGLMTGPNQEAAR